MSKEPTGEKLHTVALTAVRLLPDEWRVECVPSRPGMPSNDPAHWHEFFAGADEGRPLISVPCPDTPEALFVYLHEIAHVIFGHVYIDTSPVLEEVELMASLWAYTYMLAHGLEVPLIAKTMAVVLARLQGQDRYMPEPVLP